MRCLVPTRAPGTKAGPELAARRCPEREERPRRRRRGGPISSSESSPTRRSKRSSDPVWQLRDTRMPPSRVAKATSRSRDRAKVTVATPSRRWIRTRVMSPAGRKAAVTSSSIVSPVSPLQMTE